MRITVPIRKINNLTKKVFTWDIFVVLWSGILTLSTVGFLCLYVGFFFLDLDNLLKNFTFSFFNIIFFLIFFGMFYFFVRGLFRMFKEKINEWPFYYGHFTKRYHVYNSCYIFFFRLWKFRNLKSKKKNFTEISSLALVLNLKDAEVFLLESQKNANDINAPQIVRLLTPLKTQVFNKPSSLLSFDEIFILECQFIYTVKHLFLSLASEEDRRQFYAYLQTWFEDNDAFFANRLALLFKFIGNSQSLQIVSNFFITVREDKTREGLQGLLGAELCRIEKNQIRTRARYFLYKRRSSVFKEPVQFCILLFENTKPSWVAGVGVSEYAGTLDTDDLDLSKFANLTGLNFERSTFFEFQGSLEGIRDYMHARRVVSYEVTSENKKVFSLFDFKAQIMDLPFSGGYGLIVKINCRVFAKVFFNKNYQLTSIVYFYDLAFVDQLDKNRDVNLSFFIESFGFIAEPEMKDANLSISKFGFKGL